MKKVLSITTLLVVGTLVLTGCNKTENADESVEETSVIEESSVNEETPVVEGEYAQSLDLGELISLIENNFPKAYDYTITNNSTNENKKGTHVYTLDELGFLTPEYSNIVDREVTSSGIQDGMIYTTAKATLDDGKIIDVLYVVDPVTMNFVAANIEDGDITTNYQFTYYVNSLTFADLEEIAKSYFPESSTYTVVNLETEETANRENVYHEDTLHNLTNVTPNFPAITQQKLISSGIEDGMIYTNFDVTFENGTTGNVLYINNPESLRFVAATVENEGIYINYQFN